MDPNYLDGPDAEGSNWTTSESKRKYIKVDDLKNLSKEQLDVLFIEKVGDHAWQVNVDEHIVLSGDGWIVDYINACIEQFNKK